MTIADITWSNIAGVHFTDIKPDMCFPGDNNNNSHNNNNDDNNIKIEKKRN